MDITHLPPSRILTYHSHLSLLPSSLPKESTSSSIAISECSQRQMKSKNEIVYISKPPEDGKSPFSTLPTEIAISILSYLNLTDVLSISITSKRLYQISISSTLHKQITLNNIPTIIPNLLKTYILPSVKELTLNLHYQQYRNIPLRSLLYKRKLNVQTHTHSRNSITHCLGENTKLSSILEPILRYVNLNKLIKFNIPFSSSYLPLEELEFIIDGLGEGLNKLDLRASNLNGNEWIRKFQKFVNLESLDLAFTNIHSLPNPKNFKRLKYLSLSSCSLLSPESLSVFLSDLPPTIENLDLSRLEQIPFSALWNLKVVQFNRLNDDDLIPTKLKEIKLVGIDHLTRRDIRSLRRHWETQRRNCFNPIGNSGLHNHRINWETKELRTPEMISRTLSSSSNSSSSSLEEELQTPSTSYSPAPRLGAREGLELGKSRLPSQHTFLQSLSTSSDYHTRSDYPAMYMGYNGLGLPQRKGSNIWDDREETTSIHIIHSAILESEDEDGYRQFIGEVTGATLDAGIDNGGYVEID
ncbi:uncharacterized protein I206_101419 [Kwoniella pini CBS 10737]|uniref:F-box domain-containing protein n=1 Tax=Kwoniella pini CBS 10737 TaxID=1296096 RepID=A0A1B9HWQ1_9TREE|nr:uncharacterized protein I206_06611 [Kwoniella pini CBS 10737]OCF47705.1 hypothetical protein I206_06611 [Kwoniella pini CBS 10737]